MSDCKFQVGDEVVWFDIGEFIPGKIIYSPEPKELYVQLENGTIITFLKDGRYCPVHKGPTLFFKGAQIKDGLKPERTKFKKGMKVWNTALHWGECLESTNKAISVVWDKVVIWFDINTGRRITLGEKPHPEVTQIYTWEDLQDHLPNP